MDITELRRQLHDLCEEAGGIRKWAETNKVSFSYVASVIRGDTKPGRKILKAMGKKKRFNEKKTTIMRFEDI